jgi:uncharacterized MAPEG superfamily protein
MSFELAMLAASCVLGLVQIVMSSHAASLQRGYRWTASARDAEVAPLTGVAGRLERALRNFGETFPVFAAAVLLVHVLGRESALSEWGTGLYLSARLVYVPLYAAGVPLVRSLVWRPTHALAYCVLDVRTRLGVVRHRLDARNRTTPSPSCACSRTRPTLCSPDVRTNAGTCRLASDARQWGR